MAHGYVDALYEGGSQDSRNLRDGFWKRKLSTSTKENARMEPLHRIDDFDKIEKDLIVMIHVACRMSEDDRYGRSLGKFLC